MTASIHPLSFATAPAAAPAPPDPLVVLGGLHKRFGRQPVLRGVDLPLRRGRVTALVGPNGSGKSTLIKILLGLVRPDAGAVAFDGVPVQPGDVAYRARLGYMPQAACFPDNLTAREVIAMVRDLRGPDVPVDEALLEAFRLGPELDKPVRTLSGGTRQKVSAAVAFLFRPDLLVLDEPTAGLDPVASLAFKAAVRQAQARGATLVLTSHLTSELEALADDVAFLLDGRIRFYGSAEALKRETGTEQLEEALVHLMTAQAP